MGKAARTKVAARRTATRAALRRTPTRRTGWVWIGVGVAVVAAAAVVIVWQAGRGGDGTQPVTLTHVHGLGINPADDALYVATHDGLYQLPADGGAARLVGQGRQDTMGFTIAGPDHFLASGHPAPGQGGPPHLGLIESTDGGLTWSNLSLSGQADFHALRFRHDTVYGYNSVSGQLMVSTDKVTWRTGATMALHDLDISPTDPQTLLATTETGLQRSTDDGATWSPAGGPPLVLLAWESTDRLWAITTTATIVASADGGVTWNPSGRLAGQATAFAAHDGSLYASVHERGIYRSTDGGTTWSELYGQAG